MSNREEGIWAPRDVGPLPPHLWTGPVTWPYQAGWTPTSIRTLRAILRCRFHSSMAVAMMRPLRKRKLVSRKYWGQTLLDGRIPKKGKRTMGSRAVTERGRASVHQYTAMSRMTNRQRPSCREEMQAQKGQQSPGWRHQSKPHFALNYKTGTLSPSIFIGLYEIPHCLRSRLGDEHERRSSLLNRGFQKVLEC